TMVATARAREPLGMALSCHTAVRPAGDNRRMSRADRLRTLASVAVVIAAATFSGWRVGAQTSDAMPAALYSDLTWRCIGPLDGGPVSSVEGVAGEPGVYVITTPSGGVWKTVDGGDTWTTTGLPAEAQSAKAGLTGSRWIDPANPRRIARTEPQGIAVS